MDSNESRLEELLNQCRSNDVDAKVDALSKLQMEFEAGIEVSEPDTVINVLKSCLRNSNQHLTNATLAVVLSSLPPLICRATNPLQANAVSPSAGAIDVATLRQALTAFLPPGGLIDRLGDKERAQAKARESLVILGGFAFRASSASTISSKSGKGPETPVTIFERALKEVGLGSKVWKVREQSIITLVHIRRAHPHFPIRPYLSLLVDCLEDTDARVRESARQSIVELFSGSDVSDAARADLKKELTKKGVRKTIVDGVLSKLLGNGSNVVNAHSRDGSETGEPSVKDYVPPSLTLQGKRPRVASQSNGLSRTISHSSVNDSSRPASRTAMICPPPPSAPTTENNEIQPFYVASTRDLESEFAPMSKSFEGKETEHNWAAREQAILRVRGMLKGDVHLKYTEGFLACLKDGFIQWSLKTLASLRTTVSANTCLLYSELAVALGPLLDPFCDLLLTHLLKMAGFTKKITAQQSQASVTAIISHTTSQPRILLPLLWNTIQEKTVQARAFVIAHIKQYLEHHGTRSKHAIEASSGLEFLEKSLKKALSDPNPAVRETARVLFWIFEAIWRDRGLVIMDTLDSVARKQLEKKCPYPQQMALPPSTPNPTKKSSVAAAIAASRAKAKAIATAPPTLRHQATSGSHGPLLRRAGSPGTSPRSLTSRPASPIRAPTSPPSPSRSRVPSNMVRSVSAAPILVSRSRSASAGSDRAASPSLSTQSNGQRRGSSPLAASTTTATIRTAIRTALPASPPPSVGHESAKPSSQLGLRNGAAPVPARQPSLLPQPLDAHGDDQSLLMAQSVPGPEAETDSDDEHSVNLMSFSAPFEMCRPSPTSSKSRSINSKPTAPISNALSSGSISDIGSGQPVVEDALRARAEQAESAAERLLELVEPEDEGFQHPILPASLLTGSNRVTPKTKSKAAPLPTVRGAVEPVTPVSRASIVMQHAAMFKDSPAYPGRSTSLLDVLQGRGFETGWWLKRKTLFAQAAPLRSPGSPERVQELEGHIKALERGDANTAALPSLALICMENPVAELSSPPPSPGGADPSSPSPFVVSDSMPSLHSDMWEKNKTFERLFCALMLYLDPSRIEKELEYGLIVVWEMLENQAPYLEGKEADLFSMLLKVRYSNKLNVLEATTNIRDTLTRKLDPVYGLTTMHASLRAFQLEAAPTPSDEEAKSSTYAFGLMALGRFILRLPAEIAEEEIPRLKGTLISALNDKSSLIVRESAAASIIAAQLVLRDETHLFALLDGLADEKKNLLTYLFDKHGARGLIASGQSGMDKLEKEIRRLDTRTSTPLKGSPS